MKVAKSTISIPINSESLEGNLVIPEGAKAIVLFAHGSGSSRISPRNTFVAETLQKGRMATLLFDLLTEAEDLTYENRFDIDLITDRLLLATRWVQQQPSTKQLAIGYFGASTGTAAALRAAARLGETIKAVVSRGGRPDLAEQALDQVTAPTLFIVGGADEIVLDLNQRAYKKLNTEKELLIVPGATHLFEEQGALEYVADLASDWFNKYLNERRS